MSRYEFRIAVVALIGVLLLGILKGVLLAAVVSLLMLIAVVARPSVAFLGRIPGTRRYSDLARHPDNESIPGMLVFRVESSLLYFNAEHVLQVVRNKIRSSPQLSFVVCDLSNSPHIDVAGARMLSTLHDELVARGAQLRLAEPHARVRDLLRAAGLETCFGYFGRHLSVNDVVAEFEQSGPPKSTA